VTNERIIKLDMPLQIDSEQKSCRKMNVISLGIKWRIGFAFKSMFVLLIIKNI